MKVQVTVTLDVDANAWAGEYGVEGATEIRADVKQHVAATVRDHFDNLGVLR